MKKKKTVAKSRKIDWRQKFKDLEAEVKRQESNEENRFSYREQELKKEIEEGQHSLRRKDQEIEGYMGANRILATHNKWLQYTILCLTLDPEKLKAIGVIPDQHDPLDQKYLRRERYSRDGMGEPRF